MFRVIFTHGANSLFQIKNNHPAHCLSYLAPHLKKSTDPMIPLLMLCNKQSCSLSMCEATSSPATGTNLALGPITQEQLIICCVIQCLSSMGGWGWGGHHLPEKWTSLWFCHRKASPERCNNTMTGWHPLTHTSTHTLSHHHTHTHLHTHTLKPTHTHLHTHTIIWDSGLQNQILPW